jgi:hypothetical protein
MRNKIENAFRGYQNSGEAASLPEKFRLCVETLCQQQPQGPKRVAASKGLFTPQLIYLGRFLGTATRSLKPLSKTKCNVSSGNTLGSYSRNAGS